MIGGMLDYDQTRMSPGQPRRGAHGACGAHRKETVLRTGAARCGEFVTTRVYKYKHRGDVISCDLGSPITYLFRVLLSIDTLLAAITATPTFGMIFNVPGILKPFRRQLWGYKPLYPYG